MNLIAQKPSANPIPVGYQLVWNTEFDVAGKPNQNRWTFASGFVRNQELQWSQTENAFCEKGKRIIEARRERKPNPNYQLASRNWKENRPWIGYTSAGIPTRNRVSWKYGIFEIEAKINAQNGLWPVIWFLGTFGE